MKSRNPIHLLSLTVAGLVAVSLLSGCVAGFGAKPKETPPNATDPQKETTAVYYDFEDVLVPVELSMVKERTVIVSTPGYRSGILSLKGRVEAESLYNFFSLNMEKDNWQVVSQIKSPGTIIMVYQKTARCAVITIRDSQLATYVEIGVAPTMAEMTRPAPLLKGTDLTE